MIALDLPDAYRAQLMGLFRQLLPDAEIWAYGSRLNGTAHSTSDLDLVVRDPIYPQRRRESLWRLRDALAESDLPILVDVLDWASIPESFRAEIMRSHVVLYAPEMTSTP